MVWLGLGWQTWLSCAGSLFCKLIGGLYFRLGLTEATLFEDSSAPNGCYALPKTSGIAAKAVEAQEPGKPDPCLSRCCVHDSCHYAVSQGTAHARAEVLQFYFNNLLLRDY